MAQGKKPFFPKRSVRKEMELVEKFKELESKGKLDKYLAKRRKRNASKDHRLLPSERRKDEQ